ncbi:MAG: hypothetical protein NTX25_08510 [Proteobacteria bacterium]|nr:hypothetical protein [Pseudomonadota bacterium]
MRLLNLTVVSGLCCVSLLENSALATVKGELVQLIVRINDQEKALPTNETLKLIKGDNLTLIRGVLKDSSKPADLVNFVGFRGDGPRVRADDDLNIPIDTANLKRGWSLNKNGLSYKIEAMTGRFKHGEVMVSLLSPELQFLSIKLGDQSHRLMDGEKLIIRNEDSIKIEAIKTNSALVDKEAQVDFIERNLSEGKEVELKIRYRTFAFASIFLKVANSDIPSAAVDRPNEHLGTP